MKKRNILIAFFMVCLLCVNSVLPSFAAVNGGNDGQTTEESSPGTGVNDKESGDIIEEQPEGEETEEEDPGKEEPGNEDPSEEEPGTEEPEQDEKSFGVEYQAHVARIGWQDPVEQGEIAGTMGESLAIEALKINLVNLPEEDVETSGVEYAAHVQSYGWQDFVSNGEISGTEGKSKRVEAVKIRLTGTIAEKYDIYYRVHCQTYGWLGWAMNGEAAGSSQYAKRVEAIEIRVVEKNGEAPGSTEDHYRYPRIMYQTHVQSYGWQGNKYEDQIAGTTGESKRIEALMISVPEAPYEGGIEYRVHVQGIGWQDWKQNGELAGTTGEGRRIEAIEIRLTGEMAKHYEVYYSLHLSKIGWCNYAAGGETAGSVNLSKKVEALKIKLVEKGIDEVPDTSGTKYIQGYANSDMYYKGTIQGYGMSGNVTQGTTLGTGGESRRLENICVYLDRENEYVPSGIIKYAVHLSGTGWTDWVEQGNIAGCTDGSRGMEAITMVLSGEIEKYYDIYYRTYVQKYGWLGWAKNGQAAGTTKCGYRLEAVQIRLVSKDAAKPGENSDYYTERKINLGPDPGMVGRANLYGSTTPYIIMVDRSAHTVGIYQGWQGCWSNVQYWSCANGKPSTPTVSGVFSVGNKGYYFDSGAYRCFWWTQFYGDYLFHSVLCWPNGAIADGRVGMALSHGCVRLEVQNAKWIYDNIPRGTTVVVYN